MVLVDSNVIFDLWDEDAMWRAWSNAQILNLGLNDDLAINAIVYAEISSRFNTKAGLDRQLEKYPLSLLSIPREAAFIAGKAYLQYRKSGGTRSSILPDFVIGAHAFVLGATILTRDAPLPDLLSIDSANHAVILPSRPCAILRGWFG